MRLKPVFAVIVPLAVVLSCSLVSKSGHATSPPSPDVPVSDEASDCATSGSEASSIARKDPPELGGCNSRCRRVYCAASGSGRTYLCRCDCPK